MNSKLITVCGGGGFIGGHLVRSLLAQGAGVRAVDIKPPAAWHQRFDQAENLVLDLRELDACRTALKGADACYNLAADMGGMDFIENNKALCMLNVLINTHLLVAAREGAVPRLFFASSACVYAADKQAAADIPGLKESDAYPAMPEDGYGWEKLFSERMCRHYREDFGIITRIGRYHNVYGPHGAYEGGREKAPAAICRKVIQAKLSGRHEIEIWGDGLQTRSFMYIDDCVHGTRLLMDSDFAEPLNLGSAEMVKSVLSSVIKDVDCGLPWRDAVRKRCAAQPWLTRIVTESSRNLFFRLHPPAPGAEVLDVGAGWGQLTLPFAREDRQVTALEPTPERLAFIRAAATQEGIAERIHFVEADLLDIEFESQFDLVACVGVLEWVPRFREGEPRALQVEFLRHAGSSLKPGGSLVIGIENRLGLKYLMGARDDHIGIPGVAVYDQDLADRKFRSLTGQPLRSLVHTRAELESMLSAAGLSVAAVYAAFPDYKVPQAILPVGPEVDRFFAGGNFIPEHDGFDGSPLPFQDELRSHYGSLAALGMASEFAPSYFVVAQPA